ncbi:MAG: GNAT family N-acetyltransferase [Rhizobiaceae bacterium]|nr:GNAT family N-acetyltransferase [Rhizobiaceae bacterium]
MGEFHLKTERLIIRNWQDGDRELMHLVNSDEQVMEFFPARRNREESDATLDRIRDSINEKGYGFTPIALKDSNEPIGFCGLADATAESPEFEGLIEIGWRLAPQFWRQGYVTEAAKRLLQFGFDDMALNEIVSFAVHTNHRSTAVMERIGMKHDPARDFDHPGVPDTHPHLKRHVVYAVGCDK